MRLLLIASALIRVAFAQNVVAALQDRSPDDSAKFTLIFGGPSSGMAPTLPHRPYTAEQVTERIRILADGTRLQERVPPILMFRDSAGRRRIESVFPGDIRVVEIRDYVGGYEITLDPQNRIAHRWKFPPDLASSHDRVSLDHFEPVTTSSVPRDVIRRSLGSKRIDGFASDGTLETTMIPVGTLGNDKDLFLITEKWVARDINWRIFNRHIDPRNGETITRFVKIDQREPAPTLFQIPPDYTIKDEDGRYTIDVTRASVTSDEREIRDLVRRFADARNLHDGQTAAKAYAASGKYLDTSGHSTTGTVSLAQLRGGVTGQVYRVIRTVEMVPPNVAVVRVAGHFSGTEGESDLQETFVLAHDQEGWKIHIHEARPVQPGRP